MTTTGDIPARNRWIALAQFRIWFVNRLGPDKRGISNDAGPVKSVFSFFNIKLGHTSPSPHELRLYLPLLFICVTLTCSARLLSSTRCCPPDISSTTIDHDDLLALLG
jgi:hypothetical protein